MQFKITLAFPQIKKIKTFFFSFDFLSNKIYVSKLFFICLSECVLEYFTAMKYNNTGYYSRIAFVNFKNRSLEYLFSAQINTDLIIYVVQS